MAKIITIYCEGKSGSHDFDILSKTIGDIAVIRPIGGKRGANAIIEFEEKGTTTSDFYIFFRDRDFDCPVPVQEQLYFGGKKTYYSYRTTIENYLFNTKLFFDFTEEKTLNTKYGITTEDDVKNIFIRTAKKIKDYQAVRHTLGELRFHSSFDTTWVSGSSGNLPSELDLETCKNRGWKLVQDVVSEINNKWTEDKYLEILKKYLDLFNDSFFDELKFLIYFQGKDFAKALTSELSNFPLKDYYKFAKKHFDYMKFRDLIELREIVEREK